MVNPVTVKIPRPLYQQDVELDCMFVLQYTVDTLFAETLTGEELKRIGAWFQSRCDEKARKGGV